MSRIASRSAVFTALFALAAACSAGPMEPPPRGRLALLFTDAEGVSREGPEGFYDFGMVFVCGGYEAERKVVLKNVGEGPLTLSRMEWVAGEPVRIGDVGPENAPFSVEFEPGRVLDAQEFVELEAFAHPRPGQWEELTATVALHAADAAPGAGSVTFTLQARPASPVCEMPKTIEFGNVVLDSVYRRRIEIRNPTQLPATAFVGELQSSSGDHAAFSFSADSPRGEFAVAPDTSTAIEIDFRPSEPRPYVAFVRMTASVCCPEQVVQLTGTGVTDILTLSPAEVDCGESPLGVEVLRPLVVTNIGYMDVALWNLQSSAHSGFRVLPPAGTSPEAVTVPSHGGSVTLTVGCTPQVEGPREAILTVPTSASAPLEIPVRVTGTAQ